jgi:hypothetical protein
MEFSLAGGVVLIQLSDKRMIGANSDQRRVSVILWLEKAYDGRTRGNHIDDYRHLYPISGLDAILSSHGVKSSFGKRIRQVRVIEMKPHVEQAKRRPREVGVQFDLEDGGNLLLCHGLCNGGGFCVITADDISKELLPELFEQQVIGLDNRLT